MNYKVISHLGVLYEGNSLTEARYSVISCMEVEACFGYNRWETQNRQIYDWEYGSYEDEGFWDKPVPLEHRPNMSLNWFCICYEDICKFIEIQEVMGE